jgi:hypothetical protein
MPDYDDPIIERQWCEARRAQVMDYLRTEGVDHGEVGDWPAWHVAPYVSVWAVESKVRAGSVGWWVICGDLPTDYISSQFVMTPREAIRAIAEQWKKQAELMRLGRSSPDTQVGRSEERTTLAPLLESRVSMLLRWTSDPSLWQNQ